MLPLNSLKQNNQSTLTQFETFRNKQESASSPFAAGDEERDELLARVAELQRQIRNSNERARQLETMNNKLSQIIINHHNKDSKDAEKFISKVEKVLEQSSSRAGHSISKDSSANSKHSKHMKSDYGAESGRIKTQQSSYNDQNCSFIGNACVSMGKVDLKKKIGSKIASSHLK